MKMNTNKANAGTVTKLLKASGFTRTEWRKAGISTWNDGFDTEQGYMVDVVVSWEFAGRYAELTAEQIIIRDQNLTKMMDVLTANGYAVNLNNHNEPYLEVRKAA
jgi:hypothetical protein